MKQKQGFPNLSVKLYEDITAWKENRFIELAATITVITLRDSLFGTNEGILQFYDSKSMHTKLTGENLIAISVANSNTTNVKNRMYSVKHFATSVDNKGDTIIAMQLAPFHIAQNLKFGRSFFTNATESISEMIRVIYKDHEDISPKINGLNVFVPKVPWVNGISEYYQFVREMGLSVDNESFVFVYEDFNGINITDWYSIFNSNINYMMVGDPDTISEYVDRLPAPMVYDFDYTVKANQYTRKPNENMTIYSYSPNTKKIERIVVGDGSNSVLVNRGGGYAGMTYSNGYEEALRLQTLAQYDSYATCKTVGNFDLNPGMKIQFKDNKDQFKTFFYVDEVVHEITNNDSRTTLHMFSHGTNLRDVSLVKVKPSAIPELTTATDTNTTKAKEDSGYEWDLNILSSVAYQKASGRKSQGQCALYVRMALEQAQIKKFFSGPLGNANEMPPKLLQMGWESVGQNIQVFQKGDIAVFNRTTSLKGSQYGHVCIWTGNKWVSDFIQNSVQPSSGTKLPYTLYRAKNGLS